MWVHDLDPIVASVAGVHLWWYGLSYAAGFLNAHLFLRRARARLGVSLATIYELTLCLAVGVLVGGRLVVVAVNEWSFYRAHPALIPAVWLGGLATHGLIAGGAAGVLLYCIGRGLPFRRVLDALAVAAALILACGRIGNFIDGQIVGSVTQVPWAVKFPNAEGFRHPVVLYDGLKNAILIPILLQAQRRDAPPGRAAALFLFLYPALRMPIDLFRDYGVERAATGQMLNLVMASAGALLLARNLLKRRGEASANAHGAVAETHPGWRRWAFAALLAFVLVIPSDATRDVPSVYGARHAGLTYSAIYRPL